MAYEWINAVTTKFMSKGYLEVDSKEAVIERINAIITNAERILDKKLPLVRKGAELGWVSFSSPVWANFGLERALPISCNGSYMEDSTNSILSTNAEIGMMTKQGAGTSCYMGALRPLGADITGGGKSYGPTHFARLLQETIHVISQAHVRRGSCVIWLDIEHKDINEWLNIRSISGGVHHPIQHLSFGISIPDKWMEEMLQEKKGGEKRVLMARILQKRMETGYPYIFFKDAANRGKPEVLKDHEILFSNLCTEIMLPADAEHSFVCNLSSVNLLHYDEWKNTKFVQEMTYFLDAVLTEYIEKTASIPLLWRAHNFAKRWRAIGIGTLGYHSMLQSKMIPFESEDARSLNTEIHKHIATEAMKASRAIAKKYGEPEGLKGEGRRHLCLTAIAPTTSSSVILGQVSPSIEPLDSNIFESDNSKLVFSYRNPYLQKVLADKGLDTDYIWRQILRDGGSVQRTVGLSDLERQVFKTAYEIDQMEIVRQAADRQKYIDQGQSLNLFFTNNRDPITKRVSKKLPFEVLIEAWRLGLKSLYYHKGRNAVQEVVRENTGCIPCGA